MHLLQNCWTLAVSLAWEGFLLQGVSCQAGKVYNFTAL